MHSYKFTRRSTLASLAALTVAVVIACSSSWSSAERQNAQHFINAVEAMQKAPQLINKGLDKPGVIHVGAEEILKHQREALQEARLVADSVLDKAHPQLRQHFRAEFEKGVELLIRGDEIGLASKVPPTSEEIDLQLNLKITGTTLLNKWVDWLSAHRQEIHIPDTLKK